MADPVATALAVGELYPGGITTEGLILGGGCYRKNRGRVKFGVTSQYIVIFCVIDTKFKL